LARLDVEGTMHLGRRNKESLMRDRPYDPDEEIVDIAPDIAKRDKEPLAPAEAVKREREKYGENSVNPNRDDQWDEHHGEPDDIV
jgi:hypothetical protein